MERNEIRVWGYILKQPRFSKRKIKIEMRLT